MINNDYPHKEYLYTHSVRKEQNENKANLRDLKAATGL